MDQTSPQNISQTLLSLPVTLEGKVQLWLTYRGLKPVSTAQFLTNISPQDKTHFHTWLKNAQMIQTPDLESDEFVFVSKDLARAQRAAAIMWSENRDDIIEKGDLFGYPKSAVAAYADKEEMLVVTPQSLDKYWAPYARYLVRHAHVEEDTSISKVWADTIRKDIPELAGQFEEEMLHMVVR